MRQTPLAQFEAMARRLIEGSFKRLFGNQLDPLEVATEIARALEESQQDGQAADFFRISLHPADYELLYRQNPRLAAEMAGYVTELAREAGLTLLIQPEIDVTADSELRPGQFRVEASHRIQSEEPTQIQPSAPSADAVRSAIQAVDAFLIINGRRHAPLDQAVVNIGRRTDNDIVLDAPAVSRRHAQLRWRYNRFVVYDLSNRGRTLVNDQPVSEHALQPGDVIALSGEMLIYGEGDDERHGPTGGGEEETLVMPSSSQT